MIKILDAGLGDIPIIQDIAEQTWWPTYSSILSPEQLRYMLNHIYSFESLEKVMNDGSQKFIILRDNLGPQGFASFGKRLNEVRVYKLHKIYVLPANHGKGYGKKLIEEITQRLRTTDAQFLDLNVNRYNKAKDFYQKLGFVIIGEEDVPIGPYFMNDFVMRLSL